MEKIKKIFALILLSALVVAIAAIKIAAYIKIATG